MRIKLSLSLALAAALALLVSLASAAITVPPATATRAAPKDVEPQPHDALVDQVIATQFQRYHYGTRSLDDNQSALIFDQYLDDLDPNKSYFLQSDVDGFAVNRNKLDDDIRTGDVRPAFDIFNVYQKRVDQRIQYALKVLDHEPDLTVKESYVFDRSKGPWAKDSAELDGKFSASQPSAC